MQYEIRYALENDSDGILDIYAPYILNTCVTFETAVPSAKDFRARVRDISAAYPYFVCVDNGKIAGYAYASPYGSRAAYRYSVDSSVYVNPDYHRKGVATALYDRLTGELRTRGYYTMHALVALPNPDSMAFHTKYGFTVCGISHNSGRKMGRWIDLADLELPLRPYDTPKEELP